MGKPRKGVQLQITSNTHTFICGTLVLTILILSYLSILH